MHRAGHHTLSGAAIGRPRIMLLVLLLLLLLLGMWYVLLMLDVLLR